MLLAEGAKYIEPGHMVGIVIVFAIVLGIVAIVAILAILEAKR